MAKLVKSDFVHGVVRTYKCLAFVLEKLKEA